MFLVSRPSVWCRTHKSVSTAMKMYSSCWIPIIRVSCSRLLLAFRSKLLLNKFWVWGVTVLKLTEGVWLVKVLENVNWNKLWAVATGRGSMGMLAYYREILKQQNKRALSCQTSVLYFFKSSSGTCASSPVLLDTGYDDPYDLTTIQEEVHPLTLPFVCHLILLVNFSLVIIDCLEPSTLL
jgi:hypothetical protein